MAMKQISTSQLTIETDLDTTEWEDEFDVVESAVDIGIEKIQEELKTTFGGNWRVTELN